MDLIDKHDIVDWLNGYYDHEVIKVEFIREMIERMPLVEFAPVKHGHWVIYTISPYDGEDVKCSECGEHSCMPGWDYCPNCGAKMDGEVEHEHY